MKRKTRKYKKRRTYAMIQNKSNNNSLLKKIFIIASSCVVVCLALFGLLKVFKLEQEEYSFDFTIYGDNINVNMLDMFTLSDLDLAQYNTNDFKIDDNDIIVINDDEYKYKDVKSKNISIEDKLEVIDFYEEEIVNKKSVDFKVERKEEETIASGQQLLVQEGVNGEEVITVKIYYRNGVEFNRKELSKEVVKQSKSEILLIGTGGTTTYSGPVAAGINNNPNNNTSVLNSPTPEGNGESYNDDYTPPPPPSDSECTISINGVSYPC